MFTRSSMSIYGSSAALFSLPLLWFTAGNDQHGCQASACHVIILTWRHIRRLPAETSHNYIFRQLKIIAMMTCMTQLKWNNWLDINNSETKRHNVKDIEIHIYPTRWNNYR